MFLIKKITDKSLRDIGIFLGGRDHSTVMHALEKIENHLQENAEFKNQLQRLEEEIAG
jgi:chromosomal replication initiator protein